MNNNNHPVTHTFLFSLYICPPGIISFHKHHNSEVGGFDKVCSELNVKIRSCFLLKFWEFSSSLVQPWVVRMPQSNLMKRSWSLCVSILLIMKILRHIQRHMTKRNTVTSKTRAMNGASTKRERLVSIHTDTDPLDCCNQAFNVSCFCKA